MRSNCALLALPVLLAILTWLSLSATDVDAELFDRALGTLDRMAMAESGLHRDVLSARTGLLRQYDPLVLEINTIDDSLDQLRQTMAMDAESTDAIGRLATSIGTQEALVEDFKTKNALLQNSLAYFELTSARLSGAERNKITALAAAMLHLTLDTSAETAREVEDRLNELAEEAHPPGSAELLDSLVAHGRLLNQLLPDTDRILKTLFAQPLKENIAAVRADVLSRQAAARATARQYRLTLYAISLLLVVLLLVVGLQLRARARSAQRRAALEHVITGISMRFVRAGPHDLDANIEYALADLGQCIGADRAYFCLSGQPVRSYVWRRNGFTFPPNWPQQAATFSTQFKPYLEGIVHIPDANRLPSAEQRDACAARQLRGFACIAGVDANGNDVTLGFDAIGHPCRITRSGELGLLRMARDALANAVGRQVMEQERTRLAARLQQARRMETVGALASGIAHNFNNIIGAILGYTEMAQVHIKSGRPAGHFDEIRRAGERARDLVDQILAFGRRREARRRPVSIRNLLTESASLLQASLPSGIDLVIHEPIAAEAVVAEPGQLQQVILNLCNNAAQAMDGRGRVEIETHLHEMTRPRILSHGDLPRGRYTCVAVTDTGRGMDEATAERIFEPFFTTRVAGNGLGLATVREIVREHGGAMNVISTLGVGSRFEAWLASTADLETGSSSDMDALPLGGGKTVLLINDHREQLLRDEEILAAIGYEPVGFAGPGEGLAACSAAPQRFDAVVIGRVTPSAAALDLAAALNRVAPGMPLLLATALAEEFDADALMRAGVIEVVGRPLICGEIAGALARSLAESQAAARQR
jgi:signal transduction histidine kinase